MLLLLSSLVFENICMDGWWWWNGGENDIHVMIYEMSSIAS